MDRFTAFTTLFDPATFRHLDGLGLAAGWRCWEVGAGGTSVVRLPVRAGRSGGPRPGHRHQRVVGRRGRRPPNVEVLEHDVAADPPPGGPFDLVHARLVLVHVPERDAALATMVGRPAPRRGPAGRGRRPGAAAPELPRRDRARPGAGQPDPAGLPHPAGRARRGAGLRPHAAPPPPGRRPGPGGRRCRLPGERPRLQRPRDGDRQPDPRTSSSSTASPPRTRSTCTWPTWPPARWTWPSRR